MPFRLTPPRSRRLLIGAALLLAAGGAAIAGRVAYTASLVKPLLPAPGTFACFEGTFPAASVDMDDWSKPSKVPTGGLLPDGTPAYTIAFARLRDVPVTRFALRLDHDDRKADYDWIYNFTLVGEMTGYGTLHARGECPWYETGGIETPLGTLPIGAFGLGCGIDCDGGAMTVARITGTSALALHFGTYGLSMKRGCGGGGRFRVRDNAQRQTFTLQPAPQALCASFNRRD